MSTRSGNSVYEVRPYTKSPYRFGDYDGGMCPVDVIELLRQEGTILGTTDKNYKIYITTPFGTFKAYFYDWTESQMDELITLSNEKKITFAGGFGFYILPFFMKTKGE